MRYLASFLLAVLPSLALTSSHGREAPAPSQPVREDTRTGTVVDKQGTALVRPVGRERWTPVRQKTVLMPGDQLRTPLRGANAVEVSLAGGGSLVMGPGALVELVTKGELRVYRGELEVKAQKNAVTVTGPGGFKSRVEGAADGKGSVLIARASGKDKKTSVLKQAPRWLSGYRNSTTDEWVGSLIAKVDGRDVPLFVGYTKVDAVIRDQIAQTTVEQSFVNSTKRRLEGVFYFPLPADASISGFGMWIGNELVEADIVEKELAREIYEDIMRRKKDPGLLEWSGGNLFKARVFPIEPHSEKRIRIRYTQVLPLEGSTMRYRYALRSELLRQHPLKRLQINVTVASTMPIAGASSPSHEMRVRQTPKAAVMQFEAEEYSPERDFEAIVDLDRSNALTLVPHRRGEDGYFMMLLTPPDQSGGKWQRDLMPEGKPVDVLVLADTSGSMNRPARKAQAAFVRSLLALLGPKDTFSLLCCDIDVQACNTDPLPVNEENIEKVMTFLYRRRSLGWTDLDKALAAVQKRVGKNTTVVYVGDGIGTTGDADPVALADRLRREARKSGNNNTFHTVYPGSTYEQGVLEAIASIGGGSVRAAGDDPSTTAYRLLAESAQPAIKNLKVRFQGLRTAAVYPAQLPNLATGMQQVVLGRFLPAGGNQTGEVVVTGTLQGKPVRYTAKLRIKADETGNSFTPRLWARRHLDALLQQGRSAQIKSDIVAFSEEFGIMTPYTSFLVLESDAERKRYGVERRVRMRDGEQFFAKGRDAASTEVLRQQMKLARTFRLRLKSYMLRQIAGLGKDLYGWNVAVGYPVPQTSTRSIGGFGRGGGFRGRDRGFGMGRPGAPTGGGEWASKSKGAKSEDMAKALEHLDKSAEEYGAEAVGEEVEEEEKELMEEEANLPAESPAYDNKNRFAERRSRNALPAAKRRRDGRRELQDIDLEGLDGAFARQQAQEQEARYGVQFQSLGFPYLGRPGKKPLPYQDPKWPAGLVELIRGLDRRPVLNKLESAVVLTQLQEHLHARQGRVTSWHRTRGHFCAGSWLSEHDGRGAQPSRSWVLDGTRGVAVLGLKLGRTRKAVDWDLRFPFGLSDFSTTDVVRSYKAYQATSKDLDGDRVEVTFDAPKPQRSRIVLVIDRRRKVVLEARSYDHDYRVQSTTKYSDFTSVAGLNWARKVERFDKDNKLVQRQQLTVEARDKAAAVTAMKKAVTDNDSVVFIGAIDPKLADAKQAVKTDKAGFAEHMRIAVHYAATQQWQKMWTAYGHAAAKIEGSFALPFLRGFLETQSRKGEEFKKTLSLQVAAAKGAADNAKDFLAAHTWQRAGSVLGSHERLALAEALKPVYQREGEDRAWRDLAWRRMKAQALRSAGQVEEALAMNKATAAAYPNYIRAVNDYLAALTSSRDYRGAISYAEQVLRSEDRWLESDINGLFTQWTDGLWRLRQLPRLLRVTKRWADRRPIHQTTYQRYVSTLLYNNQVTDADKWIREHLAGETTKLSRAYQQELAAAIQLALGHGWGFSSNGADKRWMEPLARLARRLARSEGQTLAMVNNIVGNWYFRRTDEYRELRKWFLTDLSADGAVAKMSLERLGYYLGWISWSKNLVTEAEWKKVAGQVRARFDATKDKDEQLQLGRNVLRLMDARQEKKLARAFLRDWLKVALQQKDYVARVLLERVAGEDWTAARQAEMFALLPRLQPEQAEDWHRQQIGAGAARLLADKLYSSKVKALLGPVEKLEKLSRAERRQKTRDARAEAKKELATAFGAVAEDTDKWAKTWLIVEQLCFQAQTKKDLAGVQAKAAELMASAARVDPDQFPEKANWPTKLRQRCAVLMAYCATRRAAPSDLADKVLTVYTDGSKKDADEKHLNWRYQSFRLLVALDRTKALEQLLAQWIQPGKADTQWRKALAYLHAESGQLKEAVSQFEGVEKLDELKPADYQNLANWYLVLGDDDRREKAMLDRYRVMGLYQIANVLQQERYRTSRRGNNIPATLNPDVLRAAQVLMSKAPQPQNYVWYVRYLYQANKDHRIPGCLPYGVVGHTADAVYLFLQNLGSMVNQIHEEASCDSLSRSIDAQMKAIDDGVGRRGLLLLRAQVERRAAKVLNAPGDHIANALAAMKESFKGSWLPGERSRMARYLYSLGRMQRRQLADEQLRQLRELYRNAGGSAANKLTIAYHLARTYWRYNKRSEASDVLTMALADYKAANAGHLRSSANHTVNTLLNYLQQQGRFKIAETFLRDNLGDQVLQSQKNWYTQRIFQLYNSCLAKGGSISLGSGETLYLAATKELRDWIWKCSYNQITQGLSVFCSIHQTAKKAGIGRAPGDLEKFAKEALPELASRLSIDQAQRVRTVVDTLSRIRNHRVALGVLVSAIEREPDWFRRINRDGWRSYSYRLADYRRKARRLGDLRPRLLAIALRELKRDLVRMSFRNTSMFYRNNRSFWYQMSDEFASVANETIKENTDSAARVMFSARYLWSGLTERDAAVAAMIALDRREKLPDNGRYQLARWLQDMRKWSDSIPYLTRLMTKNPDNLNYRVLKINALFKTRQAESAKALFAETEKRFRDKKIWQLGQIVAMATAAKDGRYWDKGAELYQEAIRLYERTNKRHWSYRRTVSTYYDSLARCFTELRRWDEAIDAASAAVVTWGKDLKNRRKALAQLQRVFRKLPELDAYAARWDKKVQTTGLDAPVIRKTLGIVYMNRGKWSAAITQFGLARELQPNDSEVHAHLVQCYDRKDDPAGAVKALVTSIQMSPMDLKLYTSLGHRLSKAGDKAGSERAYTTMVEVKPNESESHKLLAGVFENQRRYGEAVVQWQQVVRIRSREPDGWLSLGQTQLRAGKPNDARKTVNHLLKTKWDKRFKNVDARARRLAQLIERSD